MDRKVIQISTTAIYEIDQLVALCDDGTMWLQLYFSGNAKGWYEIPNVPQPSISSVNVRGKSRSTAEFDPT